jgi:hypothetical protein
LTLAAADAAVETIVEVGTWNGLGSTLCLRNGIRERGGTRPLVSLEANREMHSQANRNVGNDPLINLVWGSIVKGSALDQANLSNEENDWFLADMINIDSAPDVLEQVPSSIDLLLLDGGEFSSWAEFVTLRNRCQKWLFLDDTLVRKNSAARNWLMNAPDSRFVLAYESTDRNGWSVFIRSE